MPVRLPLITLMRLSRAREPFDSPDCIFELKHDGFRALAYVERGVCRLISRNGHEFKGFRPLCEEIARNLKVRNAILDGEICCLGSDGRSLFNELLFRRGVPHFYAFDLLWLNGRDLRQWSKAAQHHAGRWGSGSVHRAHGRNRHQAVRGRLPA